MTTTTARRILAAIAAAVIAVGLTGCAQAGGGATTCGEYLSMDADGQSAVVKRMLTDRGASTNNGTINLTKGEVWTYCQTLGSDSSTIDSIYGWETILPT